MYKLDHSVQASRPTKSDTISSLLKLVFQNLEKCYLTSSWVDGGGTGAKWLLISLGLSDWSSLSFIPVFSIILICNPWHTIFLMCEYVLPSFTVKTDHRPLFCWSISCSYKILKCLWVMYKTSITQTGRNSSTSRASGVRIGRLWVRTLAESNQRL